MYMVNSLIQDPCKAVKNVDVIFLLRSHKHGQIVDKITKVIRFLNPLNNSNSFSIFFNKLQKFSG